jgi:S-adenosylmethionine/arginine decarboxylase-like enzyme
MGALMHENKEYFGKHLLVDIDGCNDNLFLIDFWKNWFETLLKIIDMKPFCELFIDEFGEDDLLGISAVQMIYTSSITMHTYYKTKSVYLDVFSCKEYDEKKVIAHLLKHLKPNIESAKFKVFYR